MAPPRNLAGHAALVTGAGRRLGRAFAEAIAAGGADLAVHYSGSRTGAEEVVEGARAVGRRAVSLRADLSTVDEVSSLVPRAAEALGLERIPAVVE